MIDRDILHTFLVKRCPLSELAGLAGVLAASPHTSTVPPIIATLARHSQPTLPPPRPTPEPDGPPDSYQARVEVASDIVDMVTQTRELAQLLAMAMHTERLVELCAIGNRPLNFHNWTRPELEECLTARLHGPAIRPRDDLPLISLRAEREHTTWEWTHSREYFVGGNLPAPASLRPAAPWSLDRYHMAAVAKLLNWHHHGQQKGVLAMPPAAGLRPVALELVMSVVMQGDAVLWLTAHDELVDAVLAELLPRCASHAHPVSVGRWQAGQRKSEGPCSIVVAALPALVEQQGLALPEAQALSRQHSGFELVILDDCEGLANAGCENALRLLGQDAKQLGLRTIDEAVALPFLEGTDIPPSHAARASADESCVGAFSNHVIHELAPAALARTQLIATPRVVSVAAGRTLTPSADDLAYTLIRHELPAGLRRAIATDEPRTQLIVDTFVRNADTWQQTVVIANHRAHAEALRSAFVARGIYAGLLDSKLTPADRRDVRNRFASRQLQVLIDERPCAEGPAAQLHHTTFIARPTRNAALFRTMVARGLAGAKRDGRKLGFVVYFHDELEGLPAPWMQSATVDAMPAYAVKVSGPTWTIEPR